MSRLPSDAASRNMSACSVHAMSQVGCRLMVASRANTSLPRASARCGDIARALATKAAMSSDGDVRASGKEPALRVSGELAWRTSCPDGGLVGLPAISACLLRQTLCGLRRWIGQRDPRAWLDSAPGGQSQLVADGSFSPLVSDLVKDSDFL